MEQNALRDTWEEICFRLSDDIRPNINENVFEQKVLFVLETSLGWSKRRDEIKEKPSLPIGREGRIAPDIVLYVNNTAGIVLEVKRPIEDLCRLEGRGQLKSYMRQTRAKFGLLIGKEIHAFYDWPANPHDDLLLLFKARFHSDSAEGINFVSLFNRNSFIAGEYEAYVKNYVELLERKQKINSLGEKLQSEETKQKILNCLKHEFGGEESAI